MRRHEIACRCASGQLDEARRVGGGADGAPNRDAALLIFSDMTPLSLSAFLPRAVGNLSQRPLPSARSMPLLRDHSSCCGALRGQFRAEIEKSE